MDNAFAQLLEARFRWTKHHVIATLRKDGSPRVSGTEVHIFDGVWWLGSMPGSQKAADMRRDPRIAMHTAPQPAEQAMSLGDAKIQAVAIDRTDTQDFDSVVAAMAANGSPSPPGQFDLFRLDIIESSVVRVDGTELVITVWNPQHGVRTIRRT
jgi:Pyridoxamine 5'-phosphate oxidase